MHTRHKPWVLMDMSWLAYRAQYSLAGLAFNDAPTGVIYGILEQLRAIATDPKVWSNKIAFFMDSKFSIRKDKYPPYKATRQELTPEDIETKKRIKRQLSKLRLILIDTGFPVFRQRGYESDDLIMSAAIGFDKEIFFDELQAIIITADGDLFQCINNIVHWYDPARNIYYNPEAFTKKKGIEPKEWARVKAIAGCHSDNVKGITGIGETTAIKYITGNLPTTSKKYKLIKDETGVKTIIRNIELVQLPLDGTQDIELPNHPPIYDSNIFFDFCKEVGIKSYLSGPERRQWLGFFSGQLNPEGTRRRREK